MPFDKLLYTAKAHTTGGRDNGTSHTADGRLDIKLSSPGTPGTARTRSSCSRRAGRPVFFGDQAGGRNEKIRSRRTRPSTPK